MEKQHSYGTLLFLLFFQTPDPPPELGKGSSQLLGCQQKILTVIVTLDGAGQAEELNDPTEVVLHLLDEDAGEELAETERESHPTQKRLSAFRPKTHISYTQKIWIHRFEMNDLDLTSFSPRERDGRVCRELEPYREHILGNDHCHVVENQAVPQDQAGTQGPAQHGSAKEQQVEAGHQVAQAKDADAIGPSDKDNDQDEPEEVAEHTHLDDV